jgi:hypothetical protein
VIQFVRDVSGIKTLFVDWEALRTVGVDENSPVHVDAHDITCRDALTAILDSAARRDAPLGTASQTYFLLVTTRSRIDAGIVCQGHNTRDFFPDVYPRSVVPNTIPHPYTPMPDPVRLRVDALAASVRNSAAPETWHDRGGAGHIETVDGWLIVHNTRAVQARVAQYLDRQRWLPGAKGFAWRCLAVLTGALIATNAR